VTAPAPGSSAAIIEPAPAPGSGAAGIDSRRRGAWDDDMRTSIGWLVALALAFIGSSSGCQSAPSASPEDVVTQVVAVCRAQEAAWNRGDLEGFMSAGYARSPNLTFYSGGSVTRGYDAMLARYKQSYQSEGKEMGRLEFSSLEPLPLNTQQALLRGRWRLRFEKQDEVGGLFTLLLIRTSDGWRIVHDHTSVDAPKPKAPAE
jgi:beta-aspartyl-peptidase (threonine type)